MAMVGTARAYDFSAVSPSGHTLYYNVYSPTECYLTQPCDTATRWQSLWVGYTKPVGNVMLPETVESGGQTFTVIGLGNGSFYGCNAITSITLPSSARVIGRSAFSRCTALAAVNMPNTLRRIGRNAFDSCINLQTIVLPDSLEVVDTALFRYCTNLHVVTIPHNVRKICAWAFIYCNNLDTCYFNADTCYMDLDTNSILVQHGDVTYEYHLPYSKTYLAPQHLVVGDSVRVLVPFAFYRSVPQTISFGKRLKIIYQSFYFFDSAPTRIEFKCDSVPLMAFAWGERPAYGASSPGFVPYTGNTTTIVNIPCGMRTDYLSAFDGAFTIVEESAPAFAATSNNDSWGVVQILSSPTCSTPAVVNAVPAAGYRFDHWSDGSTQNPYSFNVDGDTEIVAYFTAEAPAQYTITATSAQPSMGTVSGGGTYEQGATATLTATPNSGYRFVRWQDDDTQNPRIVTVTDDASYTAYFEEEVGIGDVAWEGIAFSLQGTQLTIQGAEGEAVIVSDLMGRTLHRSTATATLHVDLPATGVYFVRIGERMARKVIAMQ